METMNLLNTSLMKVALRYLKKVFGLIHLSNDKFWTLKNVKKHRNDEFIK